MNAIRNWMIYALGGIPEDAVHRLTVAVRANARGHFEFQGRVNGIQEGMSIVRDQVELLLEGCYEISPNDINETREPVIAMPAHFDAYQRILDFIADPYRGEGALGDDHVPE